MQRHSISIMNTAPIWRRKTCSDCRRIRCRSGCNCDCHWIRS